MGVKELIVKEYRTEVSYSVVISYRKVGYHVERSVEHRYGKLEGYPMGYALVTGY